MIARLAAAITAALALLLTLVSPAAAQTTDPPTPDPSSAETSTTATSSTPSSSTTSATTTPSTTTPPPSTVASTPSSRPTIRRTPRPGAAAPAAAPLPSPTFSTAGTSSARPTAETYRALEPWHSGNDHPWIGALAVGLLLVGGVGMIVVLERHNRRRAR